MAVETIWMDGEFFEWEDATVHVLNHAFYYGTGIFEGPCVTTTDRGTALFRWDAHLDGPPRGDLGHGSANPHLH